MAIRLGDVIFYRRLIIAMNWFERVRRALTESTQDPTSFMNESLNDFTPRALQVLALARKEVVRFHHNFVGTEHLLLGLIALGQGTAVNVLGKLGLDLETVRREVEKQVGTGPDQEVIGNIPYTPRVKKVLALAAKESKALNHTYVGTEHILLGLLREGGGVAARVLTNLDVSIEATRQEILKELDPNFDAQNAESETMHTAGATAPPANLETQDKVAVPAETRDTIDTSKRYDVYCSERNQDLVVYRNVLFKGVRRLFREDRDRMVYFIELEQADGPPVFVAKYSVVKFCEPGVTPNVETIQPGTLK